MDIIKNIVVPTGNILIVKGDKGNLECLSLGDYGKDVNIKASFMGLDRDIGKVSHTQLLPLSDKWVITISTQYGCSMGCKFCDVPKVGKGTNVTYNDLKNQVINGLQLHNDISYTNRLNIHYARMGEPTWNWDVINFTKNIKEELYPFIGKSLIHPVVSTMLPKNNRLLFEYLNAWAEIKNKHFKGDAGLQLSINSTSDSERDIMFNNNSMCLNDISKISKFWGKPNGRKYTLNFAIADYEIDAKKLRELFDPDWFIVKLTPMHKTKEAIENDIKTSGDYTTITPYKDIEESLKAEGFDVLVFIASEYEDMGRITCGNAILSGSMPECEYTII